MKSNPLLTAALALLLCMPLSAQDGGGENREVKGRTLRIACVALAEGGPDTLWVAYKKKSTVKLTELPLSTRSLGQPFKISPSETRVILGAKTGNEEKPIEAHAIVNIPASVRKGIALLIPNGKKEGLRYHTHVIDEAKYKNGDVYLLNLTTKPFQIRIGGKKIDLAKGKSHIYQPANLAQPVNAPVQILCKFSNVRTTAEKWRMVTASTWRLRPTRKEFCIFYWNAQMGRPAVKALTAFPPVVQ